MKFWKNLPSWLKGGIIVLVLYGLVTLILIPFGDGSSGSSGCSGDVCLDFPPWILPSLLAGGLLSLLPLPHVSGYWLSKAMLILFPVTYFFLGAIIGLVIGLIKKSIKTINNLT